MRVLISSPVTSDLSTIRHDSEVLIRAPPPPGAQEPVRPTIAPERSISVADRTTGFSVRTAAGDGHDTFTLR